MSTPQIIRTTTELGGLDLDTLLINWEEVVRPAYDWWGDYFIELLEVFPLAVIATGDQVRAARKALQGEA